MRVFLDANVLFSAAYRERNGLLQLWKLPRKKVELVASHYVAQEAEFNLESASQQERLARLLRDVTLLPEMQGQLEESLSDQVTTALDLLPEKDRPVLLAALAYACDFLLTGDKAHFGPLFDTTIGSVRVMRPAEFLNLNR